MNAQTREEGRCSLAAEALRTWGAVQLRATGISMLPTLWPGDSLTIQSQSIAQVQLGDIVLYARSGRFFVHRVVRKSGLESAVTTRGDCMVENDPTVRAEELLGVVTEIRRRGRVIKPCRTPSLLHRIFARMLRNWDFFCRLVLRSRATGQTAAHAWRTFCSAKRRRDFASRIQA